MYTTCVCQLKQATGLILGELGLKPKTRSAKHPLNQRRGSAAAANGLVSAAKALKTASSSKSGINAALSEVQPIYWANRQSSYAMRTTGTTVI
jgi:hypothetical protein